MEPRIDKIKRDQSHAWRDEKLPYNPHNFSINQTMGLASELPRTYVRSLNFNPKRVRIRICISIYIYIGAKKWKLWHITIEKEQEQWICHLNSEYICHYILHTYIYGMNNCWFRQMISFLFLFGFCSISQCQINLAPFPLWIFRGHTSRKKWTYVV